MVKKREQKNKNKILFSSILTLILILTITIITQDAAAQKVLKEDWFNYEETFVIGTDVYNVQLVYPNYETIRFKQNEYTTILRLKECKGHESFTFCYQNYSFDEKENIDTRGNLVPGIQIKIIQDEGALGYKATITASESGNKFTHQEHEAILKIKNTGDKSIFGSELTIIIPENVTITNRREFTQIGNKLTIPVSVQKDQEREYKFAYTIIHPGNKKFDYNLTINDSSIRKSSFTVNGVLPYELKINKLEKIHIRQIQTLEVQIKNTHPNEDLKINELTIQAPINFQYLTAQRLTRRGYGEYSNTNTVIAPGATQTFSLRYRPFFAGTYKFNIYANIEQKHTYEVKEIKDLEVINDGLAIALTFTRKEISLGTDTELQLILKNDNKKLAYRNINAVIESELYNGTEQLEVIQSGNTITLLNKKIDPPQLEENKEYSANATITFTNDAGQIETVTLTDTFKVTGNGSLISIIQKVNPTRTVKAGEEIIMEVSIKNLMDNNFRNVEITDIHSQNVELIIGQKTKNTALSAKQQTPAYTYKIKVPQKPTNETLEIKTTVNIPELGYEEIKTTTLKIEGEIHEEELSEEEKQEIIEEQERIKEQERAKKELEAKEESTKENGFLRRMIKGIENFFSNLF